MSHADVTTSSHSEASLASEGKWLNGPQMELIGSVAGRYFAFNASLSRGFADFGVGPFPRPLQGWQT